MTPPCFTLECRFFAYTVMEAEEINAIAYRLEDLARRIHELRGYL